MQKDKRTIITILRLHHKTGGWDYSPYKNKVLFEHDMSFTLQKHLFFEHDMSFIL